MCVLLPPFPGPNWGGLTSWPELNWVVVPVASVSFPVSQGGLHSHCVRHCIVQAGCNQADESRISRNTLRAFLCACVMSENCLRDTHTHKHARTRAHTHTHTHTHTSESSGNVQYVYLSTLSVTGVHLMDEERSDLLSVCLVFFFFLLTHVDGIISFTRVFTRWSICFVWFFLGSFCV